MGIVNNVLAGASGNQGYFLSRSLRFRSSASASLTRTLTTPTDGKRWTFSAWVKLGRTDIGIQANNGTAATWISIGSNGTTITRGVVGVSISWNSVTSAIYRDPAAWYHAVWVYDSTQATASNRIKTYVNGILQTQSGTFPSLNEVTEFDSAFLHTMMNGNVFGALDGYMTEVNFIDGQALTPSSFGQTSPSTGVWEPKKYTGTYGTNGFYLPFTDNSNNTATTIGKDFSGNGNNWTPNNISVTAGVTYDSMTDVPTLTSPTAANYCVMNPLFRNSSLISDGNLNFYNAPIGWKTGQGTTSLPASKTYFEATAQLIGGANSGVFIGVATSSATQDTYQVANQWSFGGTGGVLSLYNQTTLVTPAGSSAAGDIFQVAYDGATGYLWFGKNNTWYNSTGGTTGNPATGANPTMTLTPGTEIFPCAICYANGLNFTFGQRPFAYTPPSGFVALNTFNLPTPTIGATPSSQANKYFDATTYTGNGTSLAVTNSGSMQPDFLWIKQRGGATSHVLQDSVRGAGKSLFSNATAAESGNSGDLVTSFNSNGFTVNDTYLGGSGGGGTNGNSGSYIAWQWRASNATGVTNTAGTITSTVSANTTAGFSVVTYTGNGTAGATVGHGLGVTPSMIIIKGRNATGDWQVYHQSIGNTGIVCLNLTIATFTTVLAWNNTSPSSTVFTLGSGGDLNGSTKTYVAYCFAEVAGYSRFGSYTGNGSTDGPFIFTGFRPKFVIFKSSTVAGTGWYMFDTSRTVNNVMGDYLESQLASAEANFAFGDFLSNGFKMRNTNAGFNSNGATYIYMAFAENPFKYSLAR